MLINEIEFYLKVVFNPIKYDSIHRITRIRILGLNQIKLDLFATDFHRARIKTFFGMARVSADTDFEYSWNKAE